MDAAGAELKGVRGWLLLLCLSLAVLDPFAALMSLFMVTDAAKPHFDQHPELFRLVLVSGVLRIGLMVFSLYAGISLWRILPKGVAVAKKYLLAVFFYVVLSLFLPSLVGVSRELSNGMAGENLLNALLTLAYVVVWYLYLVRSRRVKATYYDSESGQSGS